MEQIDDQFSGQTSPADDGALEVAFGPDVDADFLFKKPSAFEDHLFVDPKDVSGRKPQSFPRVEFIGLKFHKAGFETLLETLLATVGSAQFQYVVTPNVDHVVTITRSESGSDIRQAYDEADFMVCDSRILSRMCKHSAIDLEPVPGSDITRELLARLPHGKTISVIGGKPDSQERLRAMYPQFEWAFMTPPMGVRHSVEHQEAICDFVAAAGSDVTFVAIGAPQSEIVCRKLKARGDGRGLALCIGASLEFITGEKRRAPKWVQKAHGEWLFRLLCEPHRLAHRYLVKGPKIFLEWYRWDKARIAPAA